MKSEIVTDALAFIEENKVIVNFINEKCNLLKDILMPGIYILNHCNEANELPEDFTIDALEYIAEYVLSILEDIVNIYEVQGSSLDFIEENDTNLFISFAIDDFMEELEEVEEKTEELERKAQTLKTYRENFDALFDEIEDKELMDLSLLSMGALDFLEIILDEFEIEPIHFILLNTAVTLGYEAPKGFFDEEE